MIARLVGNKLPSLTSSERVPVIALRYITGYA
jgi:hypothetical protein